MALGPSFPHLQREDGDTLVCPIISDDLLKQVGTAPLENTKQ